MTSLLKATVVLPAVSALPEDNCVNSFYFRYNLADDDPPDSTDIDDIQARLVGFYNDTQASTLEVAENIGPQISRVASSARIDYYWSPSVDDPLPWGSPIAMRSWTLGTETNGEPLPAECAIVMSFHGDLTDVPQTAPNPDPPPATIRPAARMRGRVFLGPFNVNAIQEDGTTHESQVLTLYRTTIVQAGQALIDANTAAWSWHVWSQLGVDGIHSFEVVNGWVDSAFDTQRRRGQRPDARTTFS